MSAGVGLKAKEIDDFVPAFEHDQMLAAHRYGSSR